MNKLHSAVIAGVLFACTGAASAVHSQTTETSSDQPAPMSVVVSVSDQGHVTKIKYAEKLPDSVAKLLKTTISKWVTKPAVANGRHVESQVLMTVELHTKPTADGQKEVYFSYISSEAIRRNSDWKLVDGHVIYTGREYVRERGGIDPPRWENQQSAPPPPPPASPPSGSGQGTGQS